MYFSFILLLCNGDLGFVIFLIKIKFSIRMDGNKDGNKDKNNDSPIITN